MANAGSNLSPYKGATSRLLGIILRLSQSVHCSAGWLAREFGVTERTIYRDLNRMRAAGLPVKYDEDNGGYMIDWTAPMKIPTTPASQPRQKDRTITCGQCGRQFLWTVKQQRDRALNIHAGRTKRDMPAMCSRSCAARYGKLNK